MDCDCVIGAVLSTLLGSFIGSLIMASDYDWYYFKYYYYRCYWCYYWCFVSVNEAITIYWNDFKVKYYRIEETKPQLYKSNFDLLPDEMILNILQYTSKKMLSNVIQVNHKFYQIGHDKSLWHRFDLRSGFLGPSPQANLPMLFRNLLSFYDNEYSDSGKLTHCVLTPTEIREIIGNKGNDLLYPSPSLKAKFRAKANNMLTDDMMMTDDTIPYTVSREDLKRLKTEVTNQHLYELLYNSINLLYLRMHYSYPNECIQNKDCRKVMNGKEEFVEVVLNFSEYLLHSINQLEITPIDNFRWCKSARVQGRFGCDKRHIENISDRLYCLIFFLQICKVFKTTKYIYRLVVQTKLLDTIITKYGIVD